MASAAGRGGAPGAGAALSGAARRAGHTMRVLYLAVSPDGQSLVTGAGDETLRFWSVFPSASVGTHQDSVLQGRLIREGML